MNKLNLSIGVLLVGGLLMGCGSKSSGGTAGSTGMAGSAGGASGGSTGAAGAPLGDSGPKATLANGMCKSLAYPHMIGATKICVCQDSTPTGCDTACVDLKTDDDNCGACAKPCGMNATCVAGVCGASPTVAVPAPAMCGAMSLVASAGTLYWTDTMNKKVLSISTSAAAGTAPTVISSTETAPTIIVVRGTTVFWLDGMTIRKSVAGAAPTVVYTHTAAIKGLAVSDDGASVYFTSLEVGTGPDGGTAPDAGKLYKAPALATGTPTVVAIEENNGVPTALTVQGSLAAYPCDINGDVDIVTIGAASAQCWASAGEEPPGKMNMGCDRIARSQGSLNQTIILASGANVFWVDGKNVKMNDFSAMAVGANKAIASPDNNVHAIAIGGTKVFYAEFDDNAPTTGTIDKVGMMEGLTPTPLARNVNGPSSIAVDGKKVFFATATCEIQTIGTGE